VQSENDDDQALLGADHPGGVHRLADQVGRSGGGGAARAGRPPPAGGWRWPGWGPVTAGVGVGGTKSGPSLLDRPRSGSGRGNAEVLVAAVGGAPGRVAERVEDEPAGLGFGLVEQVPIDPGGVGGGDRGVAPDVGIGRWSGSGQAQPGGGTFDDGCRSAASPQGTGRGVVARRGRARSRRRRCCRTATGGGTSPTCADSSTSWPAGNARRTRPHVASGGSRARTEPAEAPFRTLTPRLSSTCAATT
jgi:hypothetical protein